MGARGGPVARGAYSRAMELSTLLPAACPPRFRAAAGRVPETRLLLPRQQPAASVRPPALSLTQAGGALDELNAGQLGTTW